MRALDQRRRRRRTATRRRPRRPASRPRPPAGHGRGRPPPAPRSPRRARRSARCRRRPPRAAPGSRWRPTRSAAEAAGAVAGRHSARHDHGAGAGGRVHVEVAGQPPHRAEPVARRAGGRVAVLQAALHVGHPGARVDRRASPACGPPDRSSAWISRRPSRACRARFVASSVATIATSPRGLLVEADRLRHPRGDAPRLADLAGFRDRDR